MIYRGAEAIVYILEKKKIVIKKRIIKKYMPELLAKRLLKLRTKKEVKILKKLENIINVPKILYYNYDYGVIITEYIDGIKLDKYLEERPTDFHLFKDLGNIVGKMHNLGIIHGDLTTSNIIYKNKLYLIDFGLAEFTNRIEDFAIDIHLLKESLKARHPKYYKDYFDKFIEGYKNVVNNFNNIYMRFLDIEKRGRYKKR